ncbi:MAG TPA: hypothetical protein VHE30_05970, partial [Polyangiaceae bacterium]|nr:hypothetical protein [Polyangiaceae bacterium]
MDEHVLAVGVGKLQIQEHMRERSLYRGLQRVHGGVRGAADLWLEGTPGTGSMDERYTKIQYLPTGAPEVIRRSRKNGSEEITRYLAYDSRGRLVFNADPNTSPNYALNATPNQDPTTAQTTFGTLKGWKYRYNDAGDLVGVSDARGCGANFFYDGLGRLIMEDYFPCDALTQAPYSQPVVTTNTSPPTLVATSGVEVAYEYDTPSGFSTPGGWSPGSSPGRLARVQDQATNTLFSYDSRGNIVSQAVQLAKPGAFADNVMANRYTPRFYQQDTIYDEADRTRTQKTGATMRVGGNGDTRVITSYSARGTVKAVSSDYDASGTSLVTGIARAADGPILGIQYGDAAQTTKEFTYDDKRFLTASIIHRNPLSGWPGSGLDTFQDELEDTFYTNDLVGNPTIITDNRTPSLWPQGSRPVNRGVTYDDLYRVIRVDYAYQNPAPPGNGQPVTTDGWISPFDQEMDAVEANPFTPAIDARRAVPSPQANFVQRPVWQTYTYDWSGNTTATDDDVKGFYDRSLGTITNGTTTAGPYRITRATTTGAKGGTLRPTYDAAGNVTALYVSKANTCRPAGIGCSPMYLYEWDELGRLSHARRWDNALLN